MAVQSYFFDAVENAGVYDRTYNASDFCSYLEEIVGDGVFPTPSTQLQVEALSGMSIRVLPGQAWIKGHKAKNTTPYQLTVPQSDTVFDRIDRITIYIDFTLRKVSIGLNKGTPAESPIAPPIVRNSQIYELGLATIRVPANATEISTANIHDTRTDSGVCGWVAGLIQQVDTATLFAEYTAAYQAYFEAIQNQVASFIDTLTQDLSVDTYWQEYTWRDTYGPEDVPTIYFQPTGYAYDPSDIITVYLNGLLCKEGVDYRKIVDYDNVMRIAFLYDNPCNQDCDLEIRALCTRKGIRIIASEGNGIIVSTGNNLIGG